MPTRLLVYVLVLFPLTALPQDHESAHEYHQHHLAVVGGFARHHGHDANFLGLEYEYRLSDKWGIGGYYEQTFNGFDLEALGLIGTYHPGGGWKLMGGIGGEGKLNSDKTKLLLRFSIGHDFHVGQTTITPLLAVDWIEDNSTATYLGVAVGFGF